jgi:hypothetical protein
MIVRRISVLAALVGLAVPGRQLGAQAIQGPTELTICTTPFTPASVFTFHGGYAWYVTYYTFPFQFGHATFSALPDPVVSDDGAATWTGPGADVECTNTWYFNPNGSVAYVRYNWHIIRYRGTITVNSGCSGDGGTISDPIFMNSYDPYAPEQAGDAVTLQSCGGGSAGTGGGDADSACHWEWMEIEISYDGGQTWHPFWSGWGQVCESQET